MEHKYSKENQKKYKINQYYENKFKNKLQKNAMEEKLKF